MSPELVGVIIGGLVGSTSSLIGIFISHWLTMKREKYNLKVEAEREFRKKLTDGVAPNAYSEGIERLYKMIDEGKFPRSFLKDTTFFDDLLGELQSEKRK